MAIPAQRWLPARLYSFFRDPLTFLGELAAEGGPAPHVRFGNMDLHLLLEPELIRDVLVTQASSFVKFPKLPRAESLFGDGILTSEGEFHLRQRRLAQPAFHRDRLAGYARVMVEQGDRLRNRWRDGETIDMAAAMNRLALAIVSETLFRSNNDDEADRIEESLDVAMHTLRDLVMPWGPLLMSLPTPGTRRYQAALARLDAIIYRMIEEHRASGLDQGDLLSMLLLARDEQGEGMSDRQLRDEVITLFVAGHETTANALAWTWYLLALHPEVDARLHAELNSVLDGGRLPAAEDVPRLQYTERVFAEAMRLFPPVWILGRRVAVDEYRWGGELSFRRDAILLVSMRVLHRLERFYPEPWRFDPERWLPEAREARPKFSYLPFGAGARLCIGERFAWMEGVLLLATLAQRFRFEMEDEQARVEPEPLMTLRPKGGLPMRVRVRA